MLLHRWLGISLGALFLAWFLSGFVMMFHEMPELDANERLVRLPPLDLGNAQVEPAAAARRASGDASDPDSFRIGAVAGRPAYFFGNGARTTTVFADTGHTFDGLDQEQAAGIARAFRPENQATIRYDKLLRVADQWSLQQRALFPLHRISVGDSARCVLYVSDRTGEIVLETTAASRRWASVGAIIHWLYFTPLRRHAELWSQVVIWLSGAGTILCLSGLVWGVWALLRYRRIPHSGWLRWHHVTSLLFGLVTLGWVFSGLLSMEPGDWVPSTGPSPLQSEAVRGGPLDLESFDLERLRQGLARLADDLPRELKPRELEASQFLGETALLARVPSLLTAAPIARQPARRLVTLSKTTQEYPEMTVFEDFGPNQEDVDGASRDRDTTRLKPNSLLEAARLALPDRTIAKGTWLYQYDAYYYSRNGSSPNSARTLPVFRVDFSDPKTTSLYFDGLRGAIVHREERRSRINRWLYHGLHSWDFPFFYSRRPLWIAFVFVLLTGGLVASATALIPGTSRLLRKTGRKQPPPGNN